VPLCCQQELHTQGLLSVPTGTNPEDSNLASVGPLVPIHGPVYIVLIENISHSTAKMNDNWIGHNSILSAITHKCNISGTCWYGLFFFFLVCGTCAQISFAPFSYTLYIGLCTSRVSSSLNSASGADNFVLSPKTKTAQYPQNFVTIHNTKFSDIVIKTVLCDVILKTRAIKIRIKYDVIRSQQSQCLDDCQLIRERRA
jgi:hypothetical protein